MLIGNAVQSQMSQRRRALSSRRKRFTHTTKRKANPKERNCPTIPVAVFFSDGLQCCRTFENFNL
jgi:hypothetical protein